MGQKLTLPNGAKLEVRYPPPLKVKPDSKPDLGADLKPDKLEVPKLGTGIVLITEDGGWPVPLTERHMQQFADSMQLHDRGTVNEGVYLQYEDGSLYQLDDQVAAELATRASTKASWMAGVLARGFDRLAQSGVLKSGPDTDLSNVRDVAKTLEPRTTPLTNSAVNTATAVLAITTAPVMSTIAIGKSVYSVIDTVVKLRHAIRDHTLLGKTLATLEPTLRSIEVGLEGLVVAQREHNYCIDGSSVTAALGRFRTVLASIQDGTDQGRHMGSYDLDQRLNAPSYLTMLTAASATLALAYTGMLGEFLALETLGRTGTDEARVLLNSAQAKCRQTLTKASSTTRVSASPDLHPDSRPDSRLDSRLDASPDLSPDSSPDSGQDFDTISETAPASEDGLDSS